MKSDSNTEMDSLLRRHARRKGGLASGAAGSSASDTSGASAGTHMDADEMNAYAEGELPEAARLRYVAHLADCDQCRTIVTGLTLSANLPVKDEERAPQQATTATTQSSWREWLAALFAPPMIRYGAMALALLCVVGVVFVAMRQQRSSGQQDGPTFIAQNNEGAKQPASAVKSDSAEQPATNASPGSVGGADNQAETKERAANLARPPTETETGGANDQVKTSQPLGATSADAPTTSVNAPAPVSTTEPAPKQEAKGPRDETLADLNRPASPAPPPSASPGGSAGRMQETAESDRLGQTRKERADKDERAAGAGVTSSSTIARESEESVRQRRPARRSEARQRSEDNVQTMTDGADASSKPANRAGARAAETRSVGGRQFRREGGAWVDTAYTSGRATVNINRGSEQYRALIADEPGISTIANQLGGEVIVVWKGRAYRIR